MKRKKNESDAEYALRRAIRSSRFTTFALVFSAVCQVLVILSQLIVKFG